MERRKIVASPRTNAAKQQQGRRRDSDKTHGKMWPGTYNLGVDQEALRHAVDKWTTPNKQTAKPKLISVVSASRDTGKPDGDHELTAEKVLGEGAQGGVWKCVDKEGRVRAVKVYDKRALRQEQIANCLRNPAIWHEYQLLRRVGGHPGVVSCDGVVLESRLHFYIPMECVNGIDLDARLFKKQGADIPINEKDIFRQLMEALGFCHEHMVAHRDLKPGNVMLQKQDDPRGLPVVKIMDFGFGAEIPEMEGGGVVQMRRPVGTTPYASPEVLRLYGKLMSEDKEAQAAGFGATNEVAGTKAQDGKHGGYYARPSDVWSSGVLLWELLTKTQLFHKSGREGGATATLVKRWKSAPGSLQPVSGDQRFQDPQQSMWRDLDPSAQNLIQCILVVNPQARPVVGDIMQHQWLAGSEGWLAEQGVDNRPSKGAPMGGSQSPSGSPHPSGMPRTTTK